MKLSPGNVWGVFTLDEQARTSTAFTREENRKLQILVNKVLRCLTGLGRETSTLELHSSSNQLSVQQRCAYFSIMSVYKILQKKEPTYHVSRFLSNQRGQCINTRNRGSLRIDYSLSISRCSYFYRSSKLFSLLPADFVNTVKVDIFKRKLKEWVQRNISIVPP